MAGIAKKKKIVAAGVCAGLLLAAAAVFFCLHNPFASPKEKVVLALAKQWGAESPFAAMLGNGSSGDGIFCRAYMEDAKDAYELLLGLTDQNISSEIEVRADTLEGGDIPEWLLMFEKVSISADTALDREKEISCTQLGLNYGGIDLISGTVYQDADHFSLEISELQEGYASVDPNTFTEDYNASALSFLWGSLEEGASYDYSIDQYADAALPDVFQQFTVSAYVKTQEGSSAILSLYQELEAVKEGNESVQAGEEAVACTEYSLTVPETAVRSFLEGYLAWLRSDIEEFETEHPSFAESFSDDSGQAENSADTLGLAEGSATESDEQKMSGNSMDAAERNGASFGSSYCDSIEEFLQGENCKDYTVKVYLDSKDNLAGISFQDSFQLEDGEAEIHLEAYSSEGTDSTVYGGSLQIVSDRSVKEYVFDGSLSEEEGSAKNLQDQYHLRLTEDGTVVYEYTADIGYDTDEKEMELSVACQDASGEVTEVTARAAWELDAETGKAGLDLLKLKVENASGEHGYKIVVKGSIAFSPYDGEVSQPEGTEYRVLEMNLFDLMDFSTQLEANWKNTKMYQLVGDIF